MPAIDPVILELRADLRRYRNELQSTTVLVDRSLGQQERAVQRLEFQMERGSGRIASALGTIKGAIGGLAVLGLAREFLSFADASKQIEAQLRLATNTFGDFGRAQADVQRIAEASRSGLAETASLYGAFNRAAADLGKTQAEAATATETFSKAMLVGGASAQDAANGTRQFLQALAGGILRAEEFNSVVEASPRVARLFAEGLNTSIGGLRNLVNEGKVTADQLFAILNRPDLLKGINDEFGQLPVTFDQAMTQVRNAATITFGAFDRGGEFSTALANFISGGTQGFADLEQGAEQLGISVRADLEGLYDAFNPMLQGALEAFGQINTQAQSSAEYIRGVLQTIDDFRNSPALRLREGLGNRVADAFGVPRGPVSTLAADFGRSQQRSAQRGRDNALSRRLDAQFGNFASGQGNRDVFGRPTASVAAPKIANPADAKKAEAARKKRQREAAAAARKAEVERQRGLRADEAFENEKAALNQDLLRARQSLTNAADVVAQYELQEIEAARVRQNAAYQAEVAQNKLTQARANELIALNDKVAAEQANVMRLREEERKQIAAFELADAGLSNEAALADAQGAIAKTVEQRRQAARRLFDIETRIERLRLQEELRQAQISRDTDRIAKARADLAAFEERRPVQKAGLEQGLQTRYQQYREAMNDTDDQLDNFKVGAVQRLESEIVNATTAALGLKGALGDVVGELIRIGIQRKLIGPIADALFGKADGSTEGTFGSLFRSIGGRASGGYVGPAQTVRVNEQRGSGVELLRMGSQGGQVIPLGQANAVARSGPTVVQQTFVLDARGGVTTQDLIEQMNGLAQQAALDGAQGGRMLANKDYASRIKPRM